MIEAVKTLPSKQVVGFVPIDDPLLDDCVYYVPLPFGAYMAMGRKTWLQIMDDSEPPTTLLHTPMPPIAQYSGIPVIENEILGNTLLHCIKEWLKRDEDG